MLRFIFAAALAVCPMYANAQKASPLNCVDTLEGVLAQVLAIGGMDLVKTAVFKDIPVTEVYYFMNLEISEEEGLVVIIADMADTPRNMPDELRGMVDRITCKTEKGVVRQVIFAVIVPHFVSKEKAPI